MNERIDLDRVLRSWLRAEAPRAAPGDLLGPVFAITGASRPLPAWRALLSVPPMRTESVVLVGSPTMRVARVVVALIVLAGLIAGGAVVGAGLLGLPAPRLALPDPRPALGACQPTLPEGVVARVDQWPQGDTTHALLSDGRFMTISSDRGGLRRTARQMTDAGVRLYLDAIEDAGLIGDCRRLYGQTLPGSTHLRAVVNGALVDTIYEAGRPGPEGGVWSGSIGVWSGSFHALDASEQADADSLIRRLENPEMWLPADAWLVPDEQIITGSEAIAEWDFLTDEWEPESGLTVQWPRGAAATPGASPLGVEPCRLLEPTKIATLIPGEWSPVGSGLLDEALPGGGVRCWFQDLPEGAEWVESAGGMAPHYSGAMYWRSFAVTVRSVPTDSAEAAALVAGLFGPTQPEAGSSEGTLWINGCFSAGCTPAIAIASEPYFVLLTTVPDTEYSRDQLRRVAVEVLRSLQEQARGTNSVR